MSSEQIRQAEQRLMQWRTSHSDKASRREAYRREILAFTLNSMAMENEPVSPERLASLIHQLNPQTPPAN
ncbi:MAG: hypothetical protein ACKN9T_02225 [Candidatus Methylumidiphilus sp.]